MIQMTKTLWNTEPVLTAQGAAAIAAGLVALGVNVSGEQILAIWTVFSLIASIIARSQVSPVK